MNSAITSFAASSFDTASPAPARCRIEPETSSATTTSMPSSGTVVTASPRCGRASATISSASAASRSAHGSQRSHSRS